MAKTVNATTTLFLNAGAQTVVELERTAIPTQTQVNGAESDGTAANAALTPASGGILTGIGAVTRINFQPETSVVPAGFYADKGKTYALRTNGLTYGWSAGLTSAAFVRQSAVPLLEFNTGIQASTNLDDEGASWTIALANGSYPVAVVYGDATSTDQTNNVEVHYQTQTDATPAATPGYESGNFDGYAIQATVANGYLTLDIPKDMGSKNVKACFIEIGAKGTLLTQAHRDRLSALVARANAWTGATAPPQTVVRQYAYQSYIDDVAAFTSSVNGGAVTRYYVASNHLYSPAAVTNGAGQVVERFAYTAYGKQTKTVMPGQVATSFNRGFTGYVADNETGLMYARARMYSPGLGNFASRNNYVQRIGFEYTVAPRDTLNVRLFSVSHPLRAAEYIDGLSSYLGHFAIRQSLDPSGQPLPVVLGAIAAWEWAVGGGLVLGGGALTWWLVEHPVQLKNPLSDPKWLRDPQAPKEPQFPRTPPHWDPPPIDPPDDDGDGGKPKVCLYFCECASTLLPCEDDPDRLRLDDFFHEEVKPQFGPCPEKPLLPPPCRDGTQPTKCYLMN